MSKIHPEPCRFTGKKHGLVLCDQGQHTEMFCTICGTSLPQYLATCYECQEAEALVPHLDSSMQALRRALVLEKRNVQ